MQMSSIVQVLTVEETDSKQIDPETGKPVKRVAARCILLDGSGNVVTVGRLRVPKSLKEKVKVGTFTATFSLVVRDYGDNKGDIVADLTDLVPVKTPAQQPAKQAA